MIITTARVACVIALAALWGTTSAQTFNNGQLNDVDYFVGNGFVRNSAGGDPTTVNALAGAQITLLGVFDTSVANFFAGSLVTGAVDANNASSVTFQGGTVDTGVVDALDESTMVINGGTFSANAQQMLRAFDTANLTINGGTFVGGQSSVLQVVGDASVTINDGSFSGVLRSGAGGNDDGGRLDIYGGSFGPRPGDARAQIVNTFFSVITIYGQSFNLPFGAITTDFNGTLVGVLANGESIDVDLIQSLRNSDTGRIVLVSAVPESSSLLLFGAGVMLLPWWAARRRCESASY